jgi:hypothetical protein
MGRAVPKPGAPADAPREIEGHVTRVWLGNRATIEVVADHDAAVKMTAKENAQNGYPTRRRPVPVKKNSTYFGLPEGTKLFDGIRDILATWPNVSDAPAPAWAASWPDPQYAELIAAHFAGEGHDVEVRQPENPDVMHGPYVVEEV